MTAPGANDPPPLDASVLICSRERPAMLLETMRSVLAANAVPAELVVIDQSATAHAELAELSAVRGCTVRYVQSTTTGLSRARNIALRTASRDIVVLIDDDMFVEPGWLDALLAGLPDGAHGVATGRVLAAPDEGTGGTVPAAALVTRDEPTLYRGLQTLDPVPGANVAMRRSFVLALGGYDERLGAGTRFGAADDNDIGHRLLLAGGEVRHVPQSVVLHRAWRSQRELVLLHWRYGRGKGAFYAKHAGLRERWVLRRAARDVRARLRRATRSILRTPRTAAGEVLALAGMTAGALEWLARERLRPRRRRHR